MCYVLLLSTDYGGDLTSSNDELVRFSRDVPDVPEVDNLAHPQRWYVGSKSECSCTFRHLHSPELGFGEAVDWFPEEPDELEATRNFIRVVRDLVENGFKVDVIDAWGEKGYVDAEPGEMEVDLAMMRDSEFRFVENYRFEFTSAT